MEGKVTPVKRAPRRVPKEMASPRTPISFSHELRQAIQERYLLTAKTRSKVCSMLERSPVHNPEMDKRQTFRNQAVQEIVSSEEKYLEQLDILMTYFVKPLKERAIIDERDHTRLFGQLEMIYNLNGEFLRELRSNLENVAQAFLRVAPFFKLYSVYAFDFKDSLLIVQSLTSKNPVFRRFIQDTECRPEVQRKLNALMIVPIQRVPRYKLLLQQVMLYTSPADQDHKLLRESIKQIESTTSHINSCISDQEVTLMLINLQNSLVGHVPHIVKPSRKIIKEGVLMKINRNGAELKRYCVLMSDIFMYCKILKERPASSVVENSLECCCIFPLKKCKVYEMFPGNFKVTCQGDGIILGSHDIAACNLWVRRLRDAIDMHIQCRQTLRKESSKRTPVRKKDVSKFENEYVLSPSKRKSEYNSVFRNRKRGSDSDDEPGSPDGGSRFCFPRKRKLPNGGNDLVTQQAVAPADNPISNLFKYISGARKKAIAPSPLPSACPTAAANSNSLDPEQPYAFASRYSDTKSYFRTNNVDTMPTNVQRDYIFSTDSSEGNHFRDALFPLRSSGGSNHNSSGGWSVPASAVAPVNDTDSLPPQRKRVKFNEPYNKTTTATAAPNSARPGDQSIVTQAQPYWFMPDESATREGLRERIYNFFASLF